MLQRGDLIIQVRYLLTKIDAYIAGFFYFGYVFPYMRRWLNLTYVQNNKKRVFSDDFDVFDLLQSDESIVSVSVSESVHGYQVSANF